jgi:hypothetical protein
MLISPAGAEMLSPLDRDNLHGWYDATEDPLYWSAEGWEPETGKGFAGIGVKVFTLWRQFFVKPNPLTLDDDSSAYLFRSLYLEGYTQEELYAQGYQPIPQQWVQNEAADIMGVALNALGARMDVISKDNRVLEAKLEKSKAEQAATTAQAHKGRWASNTGWLAGGAVGGWLIADQLNDDENSKRGGQSLVVEGDNNGNIDLGGDGTSDSVDQREESSDSGT